MRKNACSIGRRRLLQSMGGLTLMTLTIPATWAKGSDWPKQPIRFVIVFPPGASINAFARLMAEPLSRFLGQTVVVENKDGAGGMIGVTHIAQSRADGYTIGMAHVGTLAVQPAVMGEKMPYDALKDLTPIVHLTNQPNVLLVHESLPVNNFEEFVAWAKKKSGAAYATPGIATSNHITGELVSNSLKLGLAHVPYRGVSKVLPDFMGNLIPLAILNIADAMPLITDKRARAVLVTSESRLPELPDAVTIVEAGASPSPLNSWQGMFGPGNLPAAVVEKLNQGFNLALEDDRVQEWMSMAHATPVGGGVAEFQKFVVQEHAMWAEFVDRFGLKQMG